MKEFNGLPKSRTVKSREPSLCGHLPGDWLRQPQGPEACASFFAGAAREAVQNRERIEETAQRVGIVFLRRGHPVHVNDQPGAIQPDRCPDRSASPQPDRVHIVEAIPREDEFERRVARERACGGTMEGDIAEA